MTYPSNCYIYNSSPKSPCKGVVLTSVWNYSNPIVVVRETGHLNNWRENLSEINALFLGISLSNRPCLILGFAINNFVLYTHLFGMAFLSFGNSTKSHVSFACKAFMEDMTCRYRFVRKIVVDNVELNANEA